MLDKKEKLVMLYLLDICVDKKTYLISSSNIAEYVSRKYVISIAELDDIMISLSKDNYLDFVGSSSKKGYYYCVNLKNKGLTYKKDLKKKRQELIGLFIRTIILSVVSFVLGILLKIIFKG